MPPMAPHAPPPGGFNESYVERGVKRDFGFDDKSIRAGFIRKVSFCYSANDFSETE